MKILIAEDDFASRNFLQFFLKKYGEVDIAVNGAEALEAFQAALGEKKPYRLVFMDIMMPEKDGLQASSEIRALEREHGTAPADEAIIIMATALSDVKTVFAAFNKSEASDYIVKPFTVESLKTKLAELGITSND